ncbi:phage head closure protein [Weissella kandleri]|uniref:phage head closure protein n=1 Tax=Weissella kandleri TaxID=1616 RepID=UPI00387E357B
MRFNSIIYLTHVEIVEDGLGQQNKVLGAKRKVYANEFSISRAEFAAAGEKGLRPSLSFQINAVDYQNEDVVIVDDVRFHIYRVNKTGEKVTLYLEKAVGDGFN